MKIRDLRVTKSIYYSLVIYIWNIICFHQVPCMYYFAFLRNRIGGVMVSVLASSAIDHGILVLIGSNQKLALNNYHSLHFPWTAVAKDKTIRSHIYLKFVSVILSVFSFFINFFFQEYKNRSEIEFFFWGHNEVTG